MKIEAGYEALTELLRGFGAADEASGGRLLGEHAQADAEHVYGGLLTVLLRLVFLLYAEDRGLLPGHEARSDTDSVVGLFERLREDAARHPGPMDQRYGAWAGLLRRFRSVFFGAGGHGEDAPLPARGGRLFDPSEYPFLEGRSRLGGFDPEERLDPPRVSDGTVLRVLHRLLVLEGERLRYRSLDVEQLGSVYESMMGYEIERAEGPSIGLGHQHVVVNLDALLEHEPSARGKWLADRTGVEVTGKAARELRRAETPEQVVAALQRRVSRHTPVILPEGALYLQPSEERRRTGSHYTPRSLTEPVVRTTLRPVLEDLGPTPTEAQILALKVCDPAMGSGAFLVEVCRQLGEALAQAWAVHGSERELPADQAPWRHARRLVAEHCLYGVDKNPFAVNLAKLSLWLVTRAEDHAFTFLDHALECGDSLVGLTREQIAAFRWDDEVADEGPLLARGDEHGGTAGEARLRVHGCGADHGAQKQRRCSEEAERAREDARLQGDAVIAAFFAGKTSKEREQQRVQRWELVQRWHAGDARAKAALLEGARALREQQGVVPFHWEIEFPEVFGRANPGFDVLVGNPPFMGGHLISGANSIAYFTYLTQQYHPAAHYCDLVAYFLRRAFSRTRMFGTNGFVTTRTVAHGDTRHGGLREILKSGGRIYAAIRRLPWPGQASLNVSIVHVVKGRSIGAMLDGRRCARITAFLLSRGGDDDPRKLRANSNMFSKGSQIYGQGFLFEDGNPRATPVAQMQRIIAGEPRYGSRIFPFIGGRELLNQPVPTAHRWVIFLSDLKREAELDEWPALADIVRRKVRPGRQRLGDNPVNRPLKNKWWAYQAHRPDFYSSIAGHERVLAISEATKYVAFTFLPADMIFSHKLVLFNSSSYGHFGVLQSRVHEVWVATFSSQRGDGHNYAASDCFATFPLPPDDAVACEERARRYYDHRAALMLRNEEGLTKTYNRFHDPDPTDPGVLELRSLHDAVDRAVLASYGWDDLAARAECEFQLEHEDPHDGGVDDDVDSPTKHKNRRWRYTWNQDLRDEVLARLLALNRQYAEQDRLAGRDAELPVTHKSKASPKGRKTTGRE